MLKGSSNAGLLSLIGGLATLSFPIKLFIHIVLGMAGKVLLHMCDYISYPPPPI